MEDARQIFTYIFADGSRKLKEENAWLRGMKEDLERNLDEGHRAWQRVNLDEVPVEGTPELEESVDPAEKDRVEEMLPKRQKNQMKKRRQKERKAKQRNGRLLMVVRRTRDQEE